MKTPNQTFDPLAFRAIPTKYRNQYPEFNTPKKPVLKLSGFKGFKSEGAENAYARHICGTEI
mgnify:CR=1 FL=1